MKKKTADTILVVLIKKLFRETKLKTLFGSFVLHGFSNVFVLLN